MGNKEAKFKGQGKVLGTGEVVNAPKQKGPSILGKATATQSQQATASKPPSKTKAGAAPLTEAEKEQRRRAAAEAASARERAWEERIARQRAKREEIEGKNPTVQRAWNEVGPQPELPPLNPETVRKQKETAEALAKSGFNPFQATMSTSNNARTVIDSIHLGDAPGVDAAASDRTVQSPPTLSRDSSASVDEMQRARTRLQVAMKGSDAAAIKAALVDAERFEVPETEEAKDLLLALLQENQTTPNPVLSDDDVSVAIIELTNSAESADKKAVCVTTMQTLLKNLLEHPENPKFRKIRLENKVIREKIVEPCEGAAISVLESVGFTRQVDDDGQQCLVVPDPETLPPEVVAYARNACETALKCLQNLKI